jgi:hydrogenase expression/formation protein HypE
VVAGDTKVVEAGTGPFVNTAGVGLIPDGLDISGRNARVGDAVLITGDIGRHGVAVLSRREGLSFATDVRSDVAPLAGLVGGLLAAGLEVHTLRDPTRGGLAETLNEIAAQSGVEVEIDEAEIPIDPGVRSACDLLGLDPLHVANEGCAVVVLPQEQAQRALQVLWTQPAGVSARRIGTVVGTNPRVVARTALGGRRLVDAPSGELLPRIC